MKKFYLQLIYKILAFYARKVINRYQPTIIAVTGSVGKTTTKEAIYKVLHGKYKENVRKNEGNLNAEIGLPLTILGYGKLPNKFAWPAFLFLALFRLRVKSYPKILVLEMGIEKPGDMKYLTSIVKPDYVVLTSITPAHLTYFSSQGEYEKEKLSIIEKAKEKSTVLLNMDDEALVKVADKDYKSVSITNKNSDYRAEGIKTTTCGTEYRISYLGHVISARTKMLGKQAVYSQLFAFAIADLFGIQAMKISKSLQEIAPVNGRMNMIDGKDNTKIIDDTYNANPSSVVAALDVLADIKYSKRKVAIIGNMNELGNMEKKYHGEIGKYAKGKCDLAIFVGPNSKIMAEGYGDRSSSLVFESRKELTLSLNSIIMEGDLILVKASQNNNFFEEVTKYLMKNPAEASKILVRQNKFWLKKKKI